MRSIFRQKALDRLTAPDELDRLLVVVHRKAWVPLATLACLCIAAVIWGIWGRIPVTVDGQGVLINPGHVKGLQCSAAGQLVELSLRVGERIEKGQVIAILNQGALENELQQTEAKLRELVASDAASDALDATRWDLERGSNDAQREDLREEVAKLERMSAAIVQKDATFREAQRKNLDRTKQLSQQLHTSLEQHFGQVRKLKSEGLTAGPLVLSSEREYTESQLRLAGIEVQLRELDLREIESSEKQLQQQNRISDLTLQLKQLDVAEQRLHQQMVEANQLRETQLSDLRRQLERLKLDLERKSQIKSEYSGHVLEITASAGQLVQSGERLGTVEVDDPRAELKNLAYFAVKDGKRIQPGMIVRVTPATVQREREGAILGEVISVSSFPITQQGASNLVGNQEIAALLTRSGGMIEVVMSLERDPRSYSGFRWTGKGPRLKFSAGTTTTVRVTVEERRPMTFVLPILRTWVFGEKDENLDPKSEP